LRAERKLRMACTIFLREEIAATGSTPLAFEIPFPSDRELPPPLTALRDALRLDTPHGSMKLNGCIDRIDIADDGTLRVIDYKTGADRTDAKRSRSSGSTLQAAIYIEAGRRMAAAGITSDTRCYYRFLSTKEQGREKEIDGSDTDLRLRTGLLLALMQRGSYPHTADPATCRGCEYVQLCGNPDITADRMKRKCANPANVDLAPWRELRDAR